MTLEERLDDLTNEILKISSRVDTLIRIEAARRHESGDCDCHNNSHTCEIAKILSEINGRVGPC